MSIFKAYDIRGTYPDEYNEDTAFTIGLAIADIFKPATAVIGRDGRTSSESISSALSRALLQAGCRVIDIGKVSTPMLYHFSGSQKLDVGLMVTASHNPSNFNGLKICKKGALPVLPAQIASIGRWVEGSSRQRLTRETLNPSVPQVETADPFPDYTRYVEGFASFRKKFRIAVDTGNAICGYVIPKVFQGMESSLEIVPLFFELDGRFPNHQPDPLQEETTKDLKQAVIDHKCDFGAALDGDGDRVIFIDDQGQYVPGDFATLLIALDVLERVPTQKTVVLDPRVSKAVVEVLEDNGAKIERAPVGHSLIKEKIQNVGAVFGGELSGHYYFKDIFISENTDRAIIALLNILDRLGQPLSAVVNQYKRYFHSGEINFTGVSNKQDLMAMLRREYGDQDGATISDLDGVTVEFQSWWFNIRPSNTEDILRLNLEAETERELHERQEEISTFINTHKAP